MKKVIAILVTLMLVATILSLSVIASGSGSLGIDSVSGNRGDTVTVSVYLTSNPGLVTMDLSITYDASVLQLTNYADDGLLSGGQRPNQANNPLKLSWSDGNAYENNTATGTICTLTFKIKDDAPLGVSNISVTCTDSVDYDFGENSFASATGTVNVTQKVPTPSNAQKDFSVQYTGVVASTEIVYSLDIAWDDDLSFNYVAGEQGTWNPETHEFGAVTGAEWTDNTVAVTVTNHSNIAVIASIAVENYEDNVSVTSDKATATLPSAVGTAVASAPNTTFTLTVSGTPTESVAKVATATVSFTNAE